MRGDRLAALCVLAFGAACTGPRSAGGDRAVPPTPVPPFEGGAPEAAAPAAVVVAEEPAPALPAPGIPEPARDPWSTPLGTVAGRTIDVGDLFTEWHQTVGRDALLLIEKLVATRLAYAEADRLGLRLSPAGVDEVVASERARLDQEARRSGGGLTTDEFVAQELGIAPGHYYERLRQGVVRQLIAERVVRAYSMSLENADVRIIVTADEAGIQRVRERLDAGADFADVAREVSLDDSANRGGRVSWLARVEGSPLSRAAFELSPGAVSGPIEAAGHFVLVRLDTRRPAREGRWDEVGEAVEASLAADPVLESEFLHWKVSMERRYPVDLTPFLQFFGEPR
jgi:hypothetical protein